MDWQEQANATEARLRGQLLATANRGDGAGGYLFGGQGSAEPPFVDAAGGVAFRGAAGELQAALDETLPLSMDGRAPWLATGSGNGLFETRVLTATPDQAGGWIDAGRVTRLSGFDWHSASMPVLYFMGSCLR